MTLRLPLIETPRLVIREFQQADLDDVHRLLDGEGDGGNSAAERRAWLDWSIANYAQHAALFQPPYGERAALLAASGELIGVVGYSPMFHPLAGMLAGQRPDRARWLPEMGLYYAFAAAHRGQGYATEAAQALVDYAFTNFNLARIVANTGFSNIASQRVMEHIGMTLHRNDAGDPDWFEVLGVLERSERPQGH